MSSPAISTTETTLQTTPEELSAALGRELRSPLTTIEGYLDLLTNGDLGTLSEEQREYLDVVTRNVRRLSTVVTDWTDMCRLEAGRHRLVRRQVDLEDVVDRVVVGLRRRIRGKSQQLALKSDVGPKMVLGDERALLRVFENLLSNANKYTQPGGSIVVSLTGESEETVRLAVSDNGIGLSDDDQAGLFRKFFRAHLTEAEPGLGLGLTLAKALVEQMGGRIAAHSALGQGSTFTVWLPRVVPVSVGLTADVAVASSR